MVPNHWECGLPAYAPPLTRASKREIMVGPGIRNIA